jgi:CheY-like chemotaxis protein
MTSILVVDDDNQARKTIINILKREGYELLGAPDWNVAIKRLKENPVDVVITDILMPEKEGLETIMELKQDFPSIKVIAMSGGGAIGQDEYLELARKFGADQTLAKPIGRQDLVSTVRELLGA